MLLLCFGLQFCSVACCLGVLWFWCLGDAHRLNLWFYFVPLFFVDLKGFVFKAHRDVLTRYFSCCSWAHRFVVFVFLSSLSLFFHHTFAGGNVKYFFGWCHILLGGRGEFLFLAVSSMRFCFPYRRGRTNIFHFAGRVYNHNGQSDNVSVFAIKNEVTENMHLWLTCHCSLESIHSYQRYIGF